MKIQTLKRTKTSTERECRNDLRKQSRNLNPQFHPMQRSREYQRAVVAAKMSRMFAKPLMAGGNMEHRDAITCSSVSRKSLAPLVAGSADGAVKLWDIHSRICVADWEGAHTRTVTGVCFDASGQKLYSCSDDGRVHRWNATATNKRTSTESNASPELSWRINGTFKSIDHHWSEDYFATASDESVQVWTPDRTTPIVSFKDLWGSADTVTKVRYHPAERNLLAHCSADRGIGLHDTRTNQNLKKAILQMRSNDLQWNPMEPMSFAVANEDYNAYTFDMRNLARPVRIYKGHVSAVMSLAWAPSGREFATGSYDRTIRVYKYDANTSREIYHTKRMQRVFTVQYSFDHKYITSGSDDGNVRVWKAVADQELGILNPRETAAKQYRQSLIQRHQHLPEVKKIYNSRKIPKAIRNQTQQAITQKKSQQRKHANRVKYGQGKFIGERSKTVVREEE